MTFPSSHQIALTFPEVVSATAAGSRLIQFPEVCFLCLNLNLMWPVPDTLHLTWTSVIGKYGGEPSVWYLSEKKSDEENKDKNKSIVRFNRILDNRIDQVMVICEYDSSKNKKVISTFKSTLPFKHIVSIDVDQKKLKYLHPSDNLILHTLNHLQ